MSIYTRTYSKKKAQAKAKEQEIEKLYERAFKGLPRPETLPQEIAGLERYMTNLQRLKDEMIRRHGTDPHFQSAFYWLDKELDTAATQIVRKKIEILQTERIGLP